MVTTIDPPAPDDGDGTDDEDDYIDEPWWDVGGEG